MHRFTGRSIIAGVAALSSSITALSASAQVIRSPIAVLRNTAGDFDSTADIGQTIDQSGLSSGFTSGVTDFATYIASNPTHSFLFSGNEWFSTSGVLSGTIVYDLGGVFSIDRLALWNEDSRGIGRMTVLVSTDPLFGTSTNLGTFSPINNPENVDYPVQVFNLAATDAQYVRLDVAGVVVPGISDSVSMGEIAFSTANADAAAAPEPATLALLAAGLLPVAGAVVRKRRK